MTPRTRDRLILYPVLFAILAGIIALAPDALDALGVALGLWS